MTRHSTARVQDIHLASATLDQIVNLRHRLLRAGLPRESAIFAGDELPTTLHFAAFSAGQALCCLTLMLGTWEGRPAWQLRGMATAASLQRTGIGRRLVHFAVNAAQSATPDIRLFWCNARVPASGFYKKLSWQVVSEPFDIPSAGPHVRMIFTANGPLNREDDHD